MTPVAAFLGGLAGFFAWEYLPRLVAAGFLALGAFLFFYKKRFLYLLVFVFIGFLYAFMRAGSAGGPLPNLLHMEGYPSPTTEADYGGYFQRIRVESAYSPETNTHVTGLREVRLRVEGPLALGRLYRLSVRVLPPEGRLNPGMPPGGPLRAELLGVLSEGPGSLRERARGRLNAFIQAAFEPKTAGFIMAVTTGEKALLTREVRDGFNRAGTGHLLSISGTHFGIFSLLVFFLINRAFRLLPLAALEKITLRISPAQAGAVLTFPFVLAYLLLSGGEVPAVRSFIMIALFLAGLLIGRRRAWLRAVAFAALLILLWQPRALLEVSFQLSFLAVVIIGFVTERLDKLELSGLKRYLAASLMVSTAVSLGLVPFTAYRFHMVSFVAPAANFFLVPVAGFVLVPLYLFSSFLYLLAGVFPFPGVAGGLTGCFFRATEFFASFRFASAGVAAFPPVLAIAALFFLAAFLHSKRKAFLALALVPFAVYGAWMAAGEKKLRVTFLDVGNADSAVMELPDGKVLLFDTARGGFEAASYLRYRGIRRLHALVLSHSHADHTGGAEHILQNFKVGEIWDNGHLVYEGEVFQTVPKRHLSRGDYLEGKGYRITALHPYKGYYTVRGGDYAAENDLSLVLKVDGPGGASVLFTGDAGPEAQEDLLHLGALLKSTFFKTPHHGARGSVWPPFLQALSPEGAVISCARENRFGHPHGEALEALSGLELFRTDLHGAVTLIISTRGVSARKYAQELPVKKPKTPEVELHNLRVLLTEP